jgi:hypothetical protein
VPDFTADLLATDNCTPADALVKTQSPAAGTLVNSGTHVITLTVTDAAGNSSACSTLFTVTGDGSDGPSITGPDSVTIEAGPDGRGIVPDFAGIVTVVEGCNGPVSVRQTPHQPGKAVWPGETTMIVRVRDAVGNVATLKILLIVVDRTAPTIRSVSVDPGVVKDDGDMVPFKVKVRATDNCDRSPRSRIVSITSSEPATGYGDNTSPDCLITSGLQGRVRAERGSSTSRLYTVTVTCADRSGNVAECSTTITVVKKHKDKKK